MNSFELNKVLGAVLGTCLIVLAINIAAGSIFESEKPAKPGYAIQVKAETGQSQAVAKKKEVPLPVRLAKASIKKGQSIARQCQACHTLQKGEPNKIGPNLWNIVDNERGKDRNGFGFSSAMKSKGGKWTFNELDKFLTDPRGYIPGTLMTFAGIQNDQQRADVIDYLHTLSDSPVALPKAQAANAPAASPAAVGGAKPAGAPKAGSTPAAPAAGGASKPAAGTPQTGAAPAKPAAPQ